MKKDLNVIKVVAKLSELYPEETANTLAKEMLMCCDILYPNLIEWTEDKPLSDIWIRDKYCINAVLKIRNDNDFVDAFLTLNAYVKDASAEYLIWKQRM